MRQFWVRHPDGYLLRPAQRILSVNPTTWLLIQIALDEGDIDLALQRLQGMAKKDGYGYTYSDRYGYYGFSDVAFEVARAAEVTRPHAAIELYQRFAERLIAMRDRKRYELAVTYLVKVRVLCEKLGEGEAWTSYVTALREQNRNLLFRLSYLPSFARILWGKPGGLTQVDFFIGWWFIVEAGAAASGVEPLAGAFRASPPHWPFLEKNLLV